MSITKQEIESDIHQFLEAGHEFGAHTLGGLVHKLFLYVHNLFDSGPTSEPVPPIAQTVSLIPAPQPAPVAEQPAATAASNASVPATSAEPEKAPVVAVSA